MNSDHEMNKIKCAMCANKEKIKEKRNQNRRKTNRSYTQFDTSIFFFDLNIIY